jgi:hypothetical protein
VVVERAATAQAGLGDDDAESSGFENIDGGFRGAGQKIIIESVGPEEDARSFLRG